MDDALECIAKVGVSGGDPADGRRPDRRAVTQDQRGGRLQRRAFCARMRCSSSRSSATSTTRRPSWPYQQYDAIIAAKKDPNAVVMLGVVPQPLEDGAQEIPGCVYDSDPINKGKIRDLIDRFPYRAYGDICAASYAPFLDQAAGLIGEACGKFVPQ
jgi:hypothetical protein